MKPNSRDARLAAALRENLRRRKAQARSRAQDGDRSAGQGIDSAQEPRPPGRPPSAG